jgi:hypothetical protein
MVTIRKIEAVATVMNGGDATLIRGRLQYLNVHHFPPGFRIGKSKRANYGMDEVLAFSLWFSLTQAWMTPIAATAFVSDFWPEFARLYLLAAQAAGVEDLNVGGRRGTIAVISGQALKSSGKANVDDLRGPAQPFNIDQATPASLAKLVGKGIDARIVIDFATVQATIRDAMANEPAPLTREMLDVEIRSFAAREGWATKVSGDETRPAPAVRLAEKQSRGQRLSEMDYYYSRALEIIEEIQRYDPSGKKMKASPRLQRLAAYMRDPSPREEWKRWVEVTDSGTVFIWSMAALVEATTDIDLGIPHTVMMSAMKRVADGDAQVLATRLRETAMRAREYEPVPSVEA